MRYSDLSAIIGSTVDARRAGIQLASEATPATPTATAMTTIGTLVVLGTRGSSSGPKAP